MVVRATEAEIDVVRMNPSDAIERFKEVLVPALREQEGYEGCYVLLSADGKVLVLTFWESDEAAQATRVSGFYQSQIEKLSDIVVYRQSPGRETYDVVVAEAPEGAIH
ncbi:MAG TPA: antibiotic biosynthesis monooxygenase [Gaiellaceae bacterium]|nr:antibiotic biosynthesis monooxygenase [Gaiellaceae bacterium]